MGIIKSDPDGSVAYLFNKLKRQIDEKTEPSTIAKSIPGYSDSGTLVLKLIDGVLQWVAE